MKQKNLEILEIREIQEWFFPNLLTWKGRWLLIIAVKKPDIVF